MLRWRIALLVSVAIAISYLDRQTLPVGVLAIKADIPMSDSMFAFLNIAFLATYGLMYLGGGKLMDWLGTRRGFAICMVFWSLACASQGLAGGLLMLAGSRLLLGLGEGGGFPAATRVVAEWFPAEERATAMGLINGGTALGGIVAPPLIAVILLHTGWLGYAPWRWMFFLTGALGLLWTLWWWRRYYSPASPLPAGGSVAPAVAAEVPSPTIPLEQLLRHRETWGLILAKFCSDAAWYFYLFWLPKFLNDFHHFDIKQVGELAWIPHAFAGLGCLVGGSLSSRLLRRGNSVGFARKFALGASALLMPLLILVPHVPAEWGILIFCAGYFGQQSWSTLVMVLPTDLFPKRAVGTVAGLVGLGGALGGIAMLQLAGALLDAGFGYAPVFAVAGSLHVIAFFILLGTMRSLQPLRIDSAPHQC